MGRRQGLSSALVAELLDLGEDVWVSQTPLWQTNAVLARSGEDALLCDPCFTADEIERLAALARETGGPIQLLITHGDFDHVCGIGCIPEAVVVAGAATAERITSGMAGEQLAAAGAEWGVAWPTALRVDRIVEPGRLQCGGFEVEAIEATGHTPDGLAYVLVEQGVLLPGDYLSDMTYPFVLGRLDEAIATVQRLLDALERHDLRWVVSGHGRALTPGEAAAVGASDLAYLEALARAVVEARADGLSPGDALLHVFEVEPPRETTPDFEIYALRSANARTVLAHA
jgi:glyoxylase-like metal-dependent hydrolase (beta-lactamase superfamily II)